MWGRRGAAVSPEGVVYMVTGDAMFSPQTKSLGNAIVGARLDENQQLQLVDYFAPPNANWMRARDLDMNVTPMAFDYRGRKFLVGTSKECRVWLLDREALGGEDHRTTLHTTPLLCNDDQAFDAKGVWGAMAAWQDSRGVQWVLVPFWGPVSRTFRAPIEYGRPKMGGVAAYKLEEASPGQWRLNPAWLSRDMDMAEEVMVANGVVFAYGSGEDTTQTLPDLAWNEPGWSMGRRRPQSVFRAAYSQLATRDALRARRSDRQRAVVQRESDHVLEPFQRHDGRQRARVPGDVRRHACTASGSRRRQESESARCSRTRHTRSIALAATIAATGHRLESGTRQPDGMADRIRRCAAHVVDPERREHLTRDHEPAGIRAAVEDDARESGAARRFAGRGRDYVGCEHLHAALDDRRSFQPGLCGRQRHRKPVLDAPFRGSARRGHCGVSRGHLRDIDADGEPHDSGSRSGEGRRARKRVLQQRGRRAWCRRTDSQPRRRGPRELPRLQRHHLRRQLQLQRPRQPLRRQRQRSRQANGVRHRSRRMRPHRDREGDCFVRPALSMR